VAADHRDPSLPVIGLRFAGVCGDRQARDDVLEPD
jgi:hypothetical protein